MIDPYCIFTTTKHEIQQAQHVKPATGLSESMTFKLDNIMKVRRFISIVDRHVEEKISITRVQIIS